MQRARLTSYQLYCSDARYFEAKQQQKKTRARAHVIVYYYFFFFLQAPN